MLQAILLHPLTLGVLAAVFYALGTGAVARSLRHLAPNVSRRDVAWNPASRADKEGFRRLASLYTPQGWRLRAAGMRLVTLSAGFVVLAIVEAIWRWR